MKYEEWIKYENIRQTQVERPVWVSFPEEAAEEVADKLGVKVSTFLQQHNPRLWMVIVQHLNPRRV